MDEVFKALADPSRRRLLDGLNVRNGQTLRELCVGLDMARQSVSKHLAVLEAANLVTTVRRGREKLHYLNGAPINDIADRWINQYDRDRVHALSDLKRALEETAMNTPVQGEPKPEFVYTSYINTTPEQLWQALTDPAFTSRYWGLAVGSDWQVGSTVTFEKDGVTVGDPEQLVLVAEPYTRLSYGWHPFTPEWSALCGLDDEVHTQVAREPRSKVTFTIEPGDELVKLTVVHDGFEAGSVVAAMVSRGWPVVISKLKTLMETGSVPSEIRRFEPAGS